MESRDDIFLAARELREPSERAAYLARACGSDAVLRAEVEGMLRDAVGADAFFAQSESRGTEAWAPPASEKPGDRIGRYKLLEKIGEGGCGVVYVAEQEEPVRRRVALKVIKLGMDTKQVVGRFEAERQALAMMDHPNIAKVFDAGATETGRPYFVMELVRGVRITEYCDQNRLPTEERLKLFVQVCHAVQHAHQKGVIHRDIKPSNILVMVADDVPVPKMIDFGIAKAIGERLTNKTVYTRFEQFIGTPAYMSPEQAGSSGLDVDTRSDIYALGVLLYELLTGRTPFEPKELAQAALDEIMRCIREKEPPKPSTRLSRLEQQEQTTTAQRRATEAPKLIRSLRGDLDWVVMKCLEKNRTRRYETASDLARDIERHLGHQPVSAAAPTLRYRAMKFIRRRGRVLTTATGFALLLILGTLTVWQARVKWALETALPQIERRLEKDEYAAAFKLVEQARPFMGNNSRFQELSARVVSVMSIATTPPGAAVFIREYSDLNSKWNRIGKSPVKRARLPQGGKRWKVSLPEYETAEGAVFITNSKPVKVEVKLDKVGSIAPGMVRIQGRQAFRPDLHLLDAESLPKLKISDFLLDRYEVTNRRFKEFVDAGGYQKPEYWKREFITMDCIELSWSDAMKLLVDQTGQPGPATWSNGDFPKGEENCPVGGVSCYEAAAYAEWAGKCLPTVYHWCLAAGDTLFVDAGYIVPLSNFGGKPAPVGTCQGMTSQGIYDLAGNVKEWCFNEAPGGCRVIAGGGWNEPQYMFGCADKYPAFFRQANFGFRCMKSLSDDGVWQEAGSPAQYYPPMVLTNQETCSEDRFQAYRRRYDYPKSALQPTTNEVKEDLSPYYRREKVSFNTAYGERMAAYLYLPRTGKRPFQTVVYFPGGSAWALPSIDKYEYSFAFENHAKNGRAFVFPVLQGTFERIVPPEKRPTWTTALDDVIAWAKDFRRTLDYLETRPEDFDTNKVSYEGFCGGGIWGGVIPAIDPRIKVVVMICGGYWPDNPPECDQINFAPRITRPILLQNGKYDTLFRYELNQKPYLKLFGTADEHKLHKAYEAGHAIWNKNKMWIDECDFLDQYLGSAK
jgi:eukaryotic-like serine/threonine-protein kinase